MVLSIARSRKTLAVQLLFLCTNSLGLLMGSIYSRKTPELYKGNVHDKLGWLVTCVVSSQCCLRVFGKLAGVLKKQSAKDEQSIFLPATSDTPMQYQDYQVTHSSDQYRYSNDSGHFTASNTSRSQSISSSGGREEEEQHRKLCEYENTHRFDSLDETEKHSLLGNAAAQRIASSITGILPHRVARGVEVVYDAIDYVNLLIGFFALGTGAVVYGGVFRGDKVFNGLAHSVKGGIFFWYGLLTLGRWMGCFAEFGWAWNVKPPVGVVSARKARIPSAEFTESLIIFLYGASNVWLEHLAAWGDAWSAQDFEHVSISIMFFGGGLCGMLVESRRIRECLNASILSSNTTHGPPPFSDLMNPPKTYAVSLNPLPGLVILLLGLMMSSHHQSSMIATMIHKQWGMLFVGFALARAVTYILMFISPPSSYLPSRPPSELISSFCLISGGLIFIASNKDTVAAMENYGLHAMFPFTVTMGLTAFLMAWVIIVLAVKGWAVRRLRDQNA